MLQSSPFNFRRAVILIGRLVLGGIFVYAGIAKIFLPNTHLWPMFVLKFSITTNLSTFAQQVESYKILSAGASGFVAHTLPFTEIVLGLLLLIGWRLREQDPAAGCDALSAAAAGYERLGVNHLADGARSLASV